MKKAGLPFVKTRELKKLESDSDLKPLNLRFRTMERVEINEKSSFPAHSHRYYELIIPEKGSYSCLLNGKNISLNSDSMLLVQYNDIHEDFYSKGSVFTVVLFHLKDISGRIWKHGIIRPEEPQDSRIIKIPPGSREAGIRDLLLDSRDDIHTIEALATALFWEMTFIIPQEMISAEFKEILTHNNFSHLISKSFSDSVRGRLSLQKLASELKVSRRTLDSLFMKNLKTSPAKAFMNFKISEAKKYLESGSTIKETAEYFGFPDQFSFSKSFKNITGIPPSTHLNPESRRHLRKTT